MRKLKIKKEYTQYSAPSNFQTMDKEVIKKAIAAIHLQETSYYHEESNSYLLDWHSIFLAMLTKEEAGSGLGYYLAQYGQGMTNDLFDIFDQVFVLPALPSDLSKYNRTHRQDERYIEYLKEYEKAKFDIINPYLNFWKDNEYRILDSIRNELSV